MTFPVVARDAGSEWTREGDEAPNSEGAYFVPPERMCARERLGGESFGSDISLKAIIYSRSTVLNHIVAG